MTAKRKVRLHYNERTGIATASIHGRTVTFAGTKEGAERWFRSLTERMDGRGLLRMDATLALPPGRARFTER